MYKQIYRCALSEMILDWLARSFYTKRKQNTHQVLFVNVTEKEV